MGSFRKKLLNTFVALTLVLQMSGLSAFLPAQIAKAADTGFMVPTSTHSDTGWDVNTVANVQLSDDVYATDNDGDEQDWSNFNFPAIPAGSTIDGVEVKVEAKSSDSSGCDIRVKAAWNNGANSTSTKSTGLSGSDVTYTFGSSSDTWGRTWSANDFTNANYVLKISAEENQGNCNNNATASYDLIAAKVYYTIPTFADLVVTKTNNVSGNVVIGNSFTWTLTVQNNGNASAVFSNDPILEDELPTNANYSALGFILGGGTTGNVVCDINNDTLVCEDGSGDVVIPAGGTLIVSFTVTPDGLGTLANPRSQGICRVDPDNDNTESNEQNNNCSNSVDVTITPSLPNPSLGATCGLDIAIVLDNSGSIDSEELAQMKTSMTAFTSAFSGTPTHFSVTKFGTTAQVVQPFSSNIATVNAAINAIPVDGGYTNWEDGLLKAQSTLNHRSNPNLVVFASDGNPNRVDNGTTVPEVQAVNEAVIVANSIKTTNVARILAMGIGGGLDTANLEAISSADAVITSGFDTLAQTLADLASELCGGTVTVTKLVDADGDLTTTGDQTVASGWDFLVDGSTVTTDVNGITPSVEVDPGTYSVTETVKSGYAVVDADCKINNQSVGTWTSGATLSGLTVSATDIVTCTFINSQLAEVTINKDVVVGSANPNSFNLYLGDTQVTNGTSYTNFAAGTYKVSEGPVTGYKMTGYAGDCYIGQDTFLYIDISLGQSVDCTLENSKLPILTLVKTVTNNNGGSADANDFQARIGETEVEWSTPVILESDGTFQVSESSLDGYSNGNWGGDCDSDGSISLEYGDEKTCTITNNDESANITIDKKIFGDVTNEYDFNISYNNNGDQDSDDFTLSDTWYSDDSVSYDVDGNASVTIGEQSNLDGWSTRIICWAQNESVIFDEIASEVTFETELGANYYCTFYNLEAGTVTITKFNDKNKNGEWDEGEETLSGWDMQATATYNVGESEEVGVVTGTTGTDGKVTLNMLELMSESDKGAVSYNISETLKAGWEQTALYCDDVMTPRQIEFDRLKVLNLGSELNEDLEFEYDGYAVGGSSQQCYIGNYQKPITVVLSDTPKLSVTGTNTTIALYLAGSVLVVIAGLEFVRRRD